MNPYDYEEDGTALGAVIAWLFIIIGVAVLIYYAGQALGAWA